MISFEEKITRAVEAGITFTNTVHRHKGDWRDRCHGEHVGQPGQRDIKSGDGDGWSTLPRCLENARKYLETL